jgi:hypothetical protein
MTRRDASVNPLTAMPERPEISKICGGEGDKRRNGDAHSHKIALPDC